MAATSSASASATATEKKKEAPMSKERSCAEALMMACDERLGAQSPAALMVCDTFLARDFWESFLHGSFPPAASQVWACGSDLNGQLGIGNFEHRKTPTEVTALHGRCIHAVACGTYHTMAVVDDGELWATGGNSFGQLGFGDTDSRNTFTRVSGLSGRKVAAVACGGVHTLALLESGELFAWGHNDKGQLGLGDNTGRKMPEPVAALSGRRVAAIACGGAGQSVAMLETGELFAWGWNSVGQLGLGDNANRSVPTQVTALAGRRVVAVSCGVYHTAAVLESGELFTWGLNEEGQLGHVSRKNTTTPQLVKALRSRPVIAVACGELHTLALLKTRKLLSWGKNDMGRLGLGKSVRNPTCTPQPVHFFDGKGVVSIHCGGSSSAAVLESGELFVWGDNFSGQLGIGSTRFAAVPTMLPLCRAHVLSIALSLSHTLILAKKK